MLTVLFYIIIGCAAIALAIALVVIAVKILLVVIPIALVVGVGVLCVKGCDNSWDLEHWFNDKTQKVLNDSPVRKYRNVEEKDLHEEIASITRQKAGVSISSLRPELERAILECVIPAYREATNDDDFRPLITSGNDSPKHHKASAHYAGAAVDFRTKDIGSLPKRQALYAQIKSEIGSRFFVDLEDVGTENEHLHVQMRNGTFNRNEVYR